MSRITDDFEIAWTESRERHLVGGASIGTCFHCGEPCPDGDVTRDGKRFCCHGCLVVHDLLQESGLARYYELSRHPGVRVRRASETREWEYLDEPGLRQRLLDFTDGENCRITFRLPAIHCVACVWLLENLFRLHPGIGQSLVNFPRREATISFSAARIKLSELVALLSSIGYEPTLTLDGLVKRPKANSSDRRRWIQIGVAGFAFGNIMLLSLPRYMGMDSLSGPIFRMVFGYLSLALALPVLFYSASDFWRSARLSLRQRVLTLDLPIVIGLAALYGQSSWEILSGRGEGYLDSLAGLVFFLLCGRAFQRLTHDRMAFDLDYKSFFPLSVTRLKPGPREERVSLSHLQVGDRVILRHGELIPADVNLVSGAALIDYSFVTGESEPVAKTPGAYLYAGGRQTGGAIEVETVKPVSQSYLASLWNHEVFQKNTRENLDTLTNRYSRHFTVIVIAMAVGAALCWFALGDAARAIKSFTSVLIVACPCALALAAPFALGTARRLLARINVFFRNPLVLERLARVDAIVFDKTGTLTVSGANAVSFHGPALSAAEASWVCSLARQSAHPHAARIAELLNAPSPNNPADSFLETTGQGIESRVAGHDVRLGSAFWLQSLGVPVSQVSKPELRRDDGQSADLEVGYTAGLETCGTGRISTDPHSSRLRGRAARSEDGRSAGLAIRLRSGGQAGDAVPIRNREKPAPVHAQNREEASPQTSAVHLAIDGQYRGAFGLSGTLRDDVDLLIGQLSNHYELVLLSGDNSREEERFRALLGSHSRLLFDQSPLDKLAAIRALRESGKTVMMVGDGLNDAGAIKLSDVGVAIVEKIGAFTPASDVILEAAQVPRLAEILTLARRSVRVVRLCFGVSALYNVIGVSIAAAGYLSAVLCAILMPLSSVSVVLLACGTMTLAARRLLRNGLPAPQTAKSAQNQGKALYSPQVSQPATSQSSKPALPRADGQSADLEVGDTAGLEACGTNSAAPAQGEAQPRPADGAWSGGSEIQIAEARS